MASAPFESLLKNHQLLDGNKRVAFSAPGVSLRLDGRRSKVEANESNAFLTDLLESGRADCEHLLPWIRSPVHR